MRCNSRDLSGYRGEALNRLPPWLLLFRRGLGRGGNAPTPAPWLRLARIDSRLMADHVATDEAAHDAQQDVTDDAVTMTALSSASRTLAFDPSAAVGQKAGTDGPGLFA
jgi:hypothetical protein